MKKIYNFNNYNYHFKHKCIFILCILNILMFIFIFNIISSIFYKYKFYRILQKYHILPHNHITYFLLFLYLCIVLNTFYTKM